MHGPSNSGFSHSGLKGYSAEKESFLHHTTQVKPYIIKEKLSSYYISSHNRMVKTSFTTLIKFLKFSNVLFTLLPHNL